MERKTLTVVEVAEMIGVSQDSIYTMVREKQIPHMRVRARILFRMETICRWMEQLETQNSVDTADKRQLQL
jgi:excisionase family DNA binding protein